MNSSLSALLYLISGVLFIMALRGLSHPSTARRGNLLAMIGMAIAIITTLMLPQVQSYSRIVIALIIGGAFGGIIALKINMTSLPQLIALFHSFVGLAAVLVSVSTFLDPISFGIAGTDENIPAITLIEMALGAIIGAITFTGSVIAFGKLQAIMPSAPVMFAFQHRINLAILLFIVAGVLLFSLSQSFAIFAILIISAFLLGILLIIPIGGADMPVVVSMLNSYSGWATCGIGFTLANPALIITGALVGSSGAILSYIMCKGMNRSILNVILGGVGGISSTEAMSESENKNVKKGSAIDAAFLMNNAASVIIVPGYGMAVAKAQFALQEMASLLVKKGITVRYAIHPVAGRMPGHMNVLLAEAGISYDDVYELETINRDFASTSVVFVIGANDITNPSAKSDTSSPIYGMPILDVGKASVVLFVKRSLAPGYAGIDNPLFYKDKTVMLLDDAKKMCEGIAKSLEELAE